MDNNELLNGLIQLSQDIKVFKIRATKYHNQCNDDMELGSEYAFGVCIAYINKLLEKYKGDNIDE